jgi:hypothetical protein
MQTLKAVSRELSTPPPPPAPASGSALASPFSKSAIRSSTLSIPTDNRIICSVTPIFCATPIDHGMGRQATAATPANPRRPNLSQSKRFSASLTRAGVFAGSVDLKAQHPPAPASCFRASSVLRMPLQHRIVHTRHLDAGSEIGNPQRAFVLTLHSNSQRFEPCAATETPHVDPLSIRA